MLSQLPLLHTVLQPRAILKVGKLVCVSVFLALEAKMECDQMTIFVCEYNLNLYLVTFICIHIDIVNRGKLYFDT